VLERVLAALHEVSFLFELCGLALFQILFDPFEPSFRDAEVARINSSSIV